VPAVLRRPLVACALLLGVYVALSFANDPRGFLGTDTGGKVATLRAMEDNARHGKVLDPDVHYWAERWDRTGRLHPLYYTSHLDGKWVNATTLPALDAAYPLWRAWGYRGALLLPMLGSVLAALAARALARRLGATDAWAWAGFWIVGLASPLTIYALDFWEHSLGVALMAWAVVLLVDAWRDPDRWRLGVGVGLLFGLAATMRTEALVYGGVATGVVCLLVLLARRRAAAIGLGLTALAGLALPLVGNWALEEATIGASLRAERAAGAANLAASAGRGRLSEALTTAVNLNPSEDRVAHLIGVVLLVLLVFVALSSVRRRDPGPAIVAGAGALALYGIRVHEGAGFVPGLIAATPVAAAGLALAWRRPDSRLVAGVAVAALLLVWRLQYRGGASPQWAGRCILASGRLLGVCGVVSLPQLERWARVGFVALATGVTAFGLAWLSIRSHDVARAAQALVRQPEPVLVSRIAHLAREGGAFYGDKRYLTAVSRDDERFAATVVRAAGFDEFGLVTLGRGRPDAIPGFRVEGAPRIVRYFSDVDVRVTRYVATR